jgi:predicted transcriptional regulator
MSVKRVAVMEKKEEDCVNLLVSLGINRRIALVLVFLANVDEATSRDIERSIDLRQSVVSNTIQALIDTGWIATKANTRKTIGRPLTIYSLAIPFPEIIQAIENKKRHEAECTMRRVRKLQGYLPA